MSKPSPDPLPSPIRRNVLWWTTQKFLQLVFPLLFRFRGRGAENIPQQGPALLLVNHQSYLDPIILGLPLTRPIVMLARENLFGIPVLGPYLRGLYGMPIDRDNPGTQAIRELLRRLDHGFLVAVYPEGTRGFATEMGPIKPGFISILRRADVPVIPVGLAGANRAMPKGSWFIRPTPIRICYGRPIPADELAPLKQRGHEKELLEVVRDRIQAEVDAAEQWRTQSSMR